MDHGEGSQKHPRHHACMLDKGYIGVEDQIRYDCFVCLNFFLTCNLPLFFFRSVIPKKKPRGGHLTLVDRDRNNKVSSDRVVIENLKRRQRRPRTRDVTVSVVTVHVAVECIEL